MRVVRIVIRTLSLSAVVAAFLGVPFCWLAVKAQGLLWGALLTLVLGRFFCDALCPLGILQSVVAWLVHPRSAVRRVCTRLPETRPQRLVRWSILALGAILACAGLMGPVTMVLPISIFGKVLTLWLPGLVVCGLVLVLSAFGRGRLWCNWICPFGTVFALLSRVSLVKDKVGAGCGNCRKCFPSDGVPTNGAGGVSRRETLHGLALLAAVEAAEKTADGGFAAVSLPGRPERANEVLPPGADRDRRYFALCAACQLCVSACPGGCLKPSVRLAHFGQPVMDFRRGYCLPSCTRCGSVCPEGAIRQLTAEERTTVHVGRAVWSKDLCLRTTGENCTACVRKCPVRAIHLVAGFPIVDAAVCIGCGACEHVCPSRPLPAMRVEGYSEQRVIRPLSSEDLEAEMMRLVKEGESIVVAREGVIVARERGTGVKPTLRLLDLGVFKGALVSDKVVGRAAAAIFVMGGARRVLAVVMSEGAAEYLREHGIAAVGETMVKRIANRQHTGECPMEETVKELSDPVAMVNALRQKLAL